MDRIIKILEHPLFWEFINKNAEAEKERVFCRHCVDVARVAYILILENNAGFAKDLVYASALLHDIGRWKEYSEGVDHAAASAELAEGILDNCGFSEIDKDIILKAVGEHRMTENYSSFLSYAIYKSDKISRPCGECKAIAQCKRFADGRQPEFYY